MNPSLEELLLKPCQVFGSVGPFDQVQIPLGANSNFRKWSKERCMHWQIGHAVASCCLMLLLVVASGRSYEYFGWLLSFKLFFAL